MGAEYLYRVVVQAVGVNGGVCGGCGGDVHERSCRALRPGGILVFLLAVPFEDRSAAYGVDLRQAIIHDDRKVLEKVVALAADGTVVPQVSRVLDLSEAAEAHRLIEGGRNSRGRIVLRVGLPLPTPLDSTIPAMITRHS